MTEKVVEYGSGLDRSWELCDFLLGVRFGIMCSVL